MSESFSAVAINLMIYILYMGVTVVFVVIFISIRIKNAIQWWATCNPCRMKRAQDWKSCLIKPLSMWKILHVLVAFLVTQCPGQTFAPTHHQTSAMRVVKPETTKPLKFPPNKGGPMILPKTWPRLWAVPIPSQLFGVARRLRSKLEDWPSSSTVIVPGWWVTFDGDFDPNMTFSNPKSAPQH